MITPVLLTGVFLGYSQPIVSIIFISNLPQYPNTPVIGPEHRSTNAIVENTFYVC